jgi:REP element-mobilizing transposase RayT
MASVSCVFLTWSTYGTWLPGDPRGYVSNTLKPGGSYEPRHNVPGTPYTADDPFTFAQAEMLRKFPSVHLSPVTARWAAEGLILAAKENKWHITRGAIMAAHVHLLLPLADHKSWWVRKILKGRASRYMSDQQRKTWRWWAAGGRDDHVSKERSLENVARYIEGQPGILAYIEDNVIVDPPKQLHIRF